jgi:hypothetical protein
MGQEGFMSTALQSCRVTANLSMQYSYESSASMGSSCPSRPGCRQIRQASVPATSVQDVTMLRGLGECLGPVG